ncbi:MAG TPA: hypothetical protein VFG45_03285, partial [Candidatus Nitrosocosmicus sp.]|nr:hypothetical protein [Candidatus Nitrosocosmicus sp.]
ETPLVDKPRKYKYNARSISDEDVLFLLVSISENGHLQAIDFSKLTAPNEQIFYYKYSHR